MIHVQKESVDYEPVLEFFSVASSEGTAEVVQ
jgi:hypothetical protein